MNSFNKKQLLVYTCVVLAIAGIVAGVVFFQSEKRLGEQTTPTLTPPETETLVEVKPSFSEEILGTSSEGRTITAYTYGQGETHLLFVGGIHGGYEWNSVLLSYQLMDYLKENMNAIPSNIRVTVIPSVNPDGVFAVIGKEGRFTQADVPTTSTEGQGRFNANNVDLNRNFDCKWKPESTWRGKTVSAGTYAFSEPEAQALKTFVTTHSPDAVIFYHSQSNAVYASECENGILADTRTLMNTYAQASGYPAVDTFDAYEVTGDAEGWLASIDIPAITVELKTHEAIEWERNLLGVQALFTHYSSIGR